MGGRLELIPRSVAAEVYSVTIGHEYGVAASAEESLVTAGRHLTLRGVFGEQWGMCGEACSLTILERRGHSEAFTDLAENGPGVGYIERWPDDYIRELDFESVKTRYPALVFVDAQTLDRFIDIAAHPPVANTRLILDMLVVKADHLSTLSGGQLLRITSVSVDRRTRFETDVELQPFRWDVPEPGGG